MLEGFSTVTSQSGRFSPACVLPFTRAFIFPTNISGAPAVCQALRGEQSGQRQLSGRGNSSCKGPEGRLGLASWKIRQDVRVAGATSVSRK